ncbi:MAG TPA: palindromic element RPE4 domain-containing protein [Rickettsia endosymbiont of Omalisus fontisbellaquei]|nr:palindromic element RPE4 domain-containing protein [Rickettsia endosymbiont of Omalisus fontisbellaquei]
MFPVSPRGLTTGSSIKRDKLSF